VWATAAAPPGQSQHPTRVASSCCCSSSRSPSRLPASAPDPWGRTAGALRPHSGPRPSRAAALPDPSPRRQGGGQDQGDGQKGKGRNEREVQEYVDALTRGGVKKDMARDVLKQWESAGQDPKQLRKLFLKQSAVPAVATTVQVGLAMATGQGLWWGKPESWPATGSRRSGCTRRRLLKHGAAPAEVGAWQLQALTPFAGPIPPDTCGRRRRLLNFYQRPLFRVSCARPYRPARTAQAVAAWRRGRVVRWQRRGLQVWAGQVPTRRRRALPPKSSPPPPPRSRLPTPPRAGPDFTGRGILVVVLK
jgi:hypothetical protein